MRESLKWSERMLVASMLFGMFFGAGNLIFPVYLGQMAGSNVWAATLGFLITGAGLPLLGVAALGISRSSGLIELSRKIGKKYSVFYTCALYLTIGPFFAVPRCASVPFTVGIAPLFGEKSQVLPLAVFSFLFFAVVLLLSLKPGKILTYIGKILNPTFLVFLGFLMITALLNPMGSVSGVEPLGDYAQHPFLNGFLEGYNTMDALCGLAFGIIVVDSIRSLDVTKPGAIAVNTIQAGFFSCLLMGLIYLMLTVIGTQSRGLLPLCENGGEMLWLIAEHYFGRTGAVLLTITVTLACLKTAVGLVSSSAETFVKLFPRGPKYGVWVWIFCLVSFAIANLGLDAIIAYAKPVLMFLYPLSIALVLLCLFSRFFGDARCVYQWVIGCTLLEVFFEFFKALPAQAISTLRLEGVIRLAEEWIPFFSLGFGWIVPALIGFVIGLFMRRREKTTA